MSDDALAAVTAERDKWRDLARKHERRVKRLRLQQRAVDRFLDDLAARVVVALRGAGYIEVRPHGAAEPNEGDTK